jgi:phage terminase small subunit
MDGLTEKQRRFVEAYVGTAQGNATVAARMAGYSGDDATLAPIGSKLTRNDKVAAAIEAARSPRTKRAIIDRERRQQLLSEIAEKGDAQDRDRIKAIEVLGKMQGDFIERHEVKHEGAAVTVYLPSNGRDG